MTSLRRSIALSALTACTMALLSAGCALIGRGSTPPPSATLEAVTDDYRQAHQLTAAMEQALDTLVITAPEDLEQNFNYYSANLERMEQVANRLLAHSDGMFYRGTFYFVERGKSLEACTLPRTLRTDDLRSIDLGQEFYPISDAGGKIKRALRAFMFDVEQIHSLLDCSLAPRGMGATDILVLKAKIDGAFLQEALRQGIAALEHAAAALPPQPGQKRG